MGIRRSLAIGTIGLCSILAGCASPYRTRFDDAQNKNAIEVYNSIDETNITKDERIFLEDFRRRSKMEQLDFFLCYGAEIGKKEVMIYGLKGPQQGPYYFVNIETPGTKDIIFMYNLWIEREESELKYGIVH